MFDIIQLNEKLLPELKDLARKLQIDGSDGLKKQDLIYKILDHQALNPDINFKDWQHAYYGDNYGRLQKVKAKYDADNLFEYPQSIKV